MLVLFHLGRPKGCCARCSDFFEQAPETTPQSPVKADESRAGTRRQLAGEMCFHCSDQCLGCSVCRVCVWAASSVSCLVFGLNACFVRDSVRFERFFVFVERFWRQPCR